VPIIRYYFEKKYNLLEYDTIKKNTEYDRKSYYISYLLTNSEYFKEIKMFSLFNFFIEKYKRLKSICNLGLICLHNKRTITYSILSIIETVIDFFITLRIITQTFIGNLLIGQFLLYNSSINNLKQNMISIFSQLSLIYKNSLIVDQIKEFFELPKEVINEDGIKIKEIKNIRLENVSYKYSGKDKYTLKNISLTFSCGDFVVLMGCNGSGKSTLMKVIMGIYHDYK
jgi:ABC-type bacteriocin/lantibiotic exporter with double-glycine peptidase domain